MKKSFICNIVKHKLTCFSIVFFNVLRNTSNANHSNQQCNPCPSMVFGNATVYHNKQGWIRGVLDFSLAPRISDADEESGALGSLTDVESALHCIIPSHCAPAPAPCTHGGTCCYGVRGQPTQTMETKFIQGGHSGEDGNPASAQTCCTSCPLPWCCSHTKNVIVVLLFVKVVTEDF